MPAFNSVRIRLRYPDLDTFIEKFAPNVTRGGVFLASRNIQPVDTVIPFEIQLAGGAVVLGGTGRVTWVKEFNPAEPNRPYGMGVQFVTLDAATKPVLARILRAKEALGPRRVTGQFDAVGGSGAVPATLANGKSMGIAIDTSVDLVAEYGLSDATVRRMIDRSWRTGGRGDDLEELLRHDPVEPVTLEQALAELPRLLDPQYSRRRATGGYRPAEALAAAATVTDPAADQATLPPFIATAASADAPQVAAEETTQQTAEPDETGDGEASDTTDMTSVRDTVDTMEVVQADAGSPPPAQSNGRRRRGSRH